jgi:hypothetical protein
MTPSIALLTNVYSAGSCLPLLEPSGCFEHELEVKLEILEALDPQYLHEY